MYSASVIIRIAAAAMDEHQTPALAATHTLSCNHTSHFDMLVVSSDDEGDGGGGDGEKVSN